ncbi:MAG: hypothetical protein KA716_05645 [Gloeotrichia echinulata DEX184]|nr:hypothetical protein [Gloeotrichia echinulata DEX184]
MTTPRVAFLPIPLALSVLPNSQSGYNEQPIQHFASYSEFSPLVTKSINHNEKFTIKQRLATSIL